MRLSDCRILAETLFKQYALVDWGFHFDNSKQRFGVCKPMAKVISLSRYLVELNNESEVKNTLLHEISHALVGPGKGHGIVWRMKARELGIKPNRCYDSSTVVTPPKVWSANCPKCNFLYEKYRKPSKNVGCGFCGKGMYNPEFILRWNRKAILNAN